MSNQERGYTINEIVNELKRLQVEHGNLEVTIYNPDKDVVIAWPEYNEEKKRIEF